MGVVHPIGKRRRQSIGDKRAFSRTGYARDKRKRAKGHREIDLLQIVLARSLQLKGSAMRMPTLSRDRNALAAAQVLRSKRILNPHYLFGRAGGNNLTAQLTRARPHIDYVVSAANGIFIMLDHYHGIAQIAQMLKRANQTLIVALVQADRRFVQNIKHAHQACTNLSGEANTLRFTT